MRFLFACGGTAGHINPALAIADTVRDNICDSTIYFAGAKHGLEGRLVRERGYELFALDIQGLKRSLSPRNFKVLYLTLKARRDARALLKRLRPDIVIGTGGYACYPIVREAQRLKIKTVLHESNSVAGLAVRMLAARADLVLLNFDKAKERLRRKDNVEVLGNPVSLPRSDAPREQVRREMNIPSGATLVLSFGGSMGAERMNDAIIDMTQRYGKAREDIYWLHACGRRDYGRCRTRMPQDREHAKLVEYIDDMPSVMSAADVVISRAGAMTLSELALHGKAAILIPSPYVTANHQYENARALADKGAAILIEERSLTCDALYSQVVKIADDMRAKQQLERSIGSFANRRASRDIFNAIISVLKSE